MDRCALDKLPDLALMRHRQWTSEHGSDSWSAVNCLSMADLHEAVEQLWTLRTLCRDLLLFTNPLDVRLPEPAAEVRQQISRAVDRC